MGLLQAVLDAVMGEDDRIGGRRFTQLSAALDKDETGSMSVISSLGFGEFEDGASDARVLINGEIIECSGRTDSTFTGLQRGVRTSTVKTHPEGSVVWDYALNQSAIDRLRREFWVNFATGKALDVIGRNLGLKKCPGVGQEQYRDFIRDVAYIPKSVLPSFFWALDAIIGPGKYEVLENSPDDPTGRWRIRITVETDLADTLLGKFVLNGGEEAETTGTNEVEVTHPILGTSPVGVLSVYAANDMTRLGIFSGATELYGGAGYSGSTIALTTSPGPAGTPVIVNYTAYTAHYLRGVPQSDPVAATRIPFAQDGGLPPDASGLRNIDNDDFWAYLSSPLAGVECALNQVRQHGIRLDLRAVSPTP